jgi:hypothetical protein
MSSTPHALRDLRDTWLEPWAPLSEWLQFRAELDLPLADGGDCSDTGFCRELVQDCKREADAEIARLRGEELSR